jgi:hypothetical protein
MKRASLNLGDIKEDMKDFLEEFKEKNEDFQKFAQEFSGEFYKKLAGKKGVLEDFFKENKEISHILKQVDDIFEDLENDKIKKEFTKLAMLPKGNASRRSSIGIESSSLLSSDKGVFKG